MSIRTQPHFVKSNESARVPRRWVYLDTEAHIMSTPDWQAQSWRLGVTCYEHRDNDKRAWIKPKWQVHTDPAAMWEWIGKCTAKRTRTVVVAHNIGYDLRISEAMHYLPLQGWEVDLMSIGGRNLTMTLHRETATLSLVDFTGFLPMSLAKVGKLMGMEKLDLPNEDDSEDAWVARCRRDVEILREANRQLLEWVEGANLGNWQKTGAGMAWASWRHKHYSHKVLVHADQEARDAEVAAAHTGRCEAWQHGDLGETQWTEWDYPMAYPRVALDTELPTRLIGHAPAPTMEWYKSRRRNMRVLLEATVQADVPVLPVQDQEGYLWPVGEFRGWWWDHELDLAVAEGADVQLHHAVLYRGELALAKWAKWVIDVVENPQGPHTELQRQAAKHWSRALIGRFGAKYPIWTDYSEAPEPGVEVSRCYDFDSEQLGHMLTIGDRCYLGMDSEYVADANPAIMGAVVSEARIRLWQALKVAGFDHVAYMDTDSLFTDRTGTARLRAWIREGNGWGLRVKDRWRNLTVLGPRQLIVDGGARIAGVPRSANRTGPRKWQGLRWDGVQTTLGSGEPGVIIVRNAQWNVEGVDRRRVHLPGGSTEPPRVALADAPRQLDQV